MGWIRKASDRTLEQSMELASAAAWEARMNGNKEREDAFHKDLDDMIDEAQRRGWRKGRS